MKKHLSLFVSLALFSLFSCEDDEPVDPKIETTEVIVTSASTFTVKGMVETIGTIPIVDYGFVYSRNEYISEYYDIAGGTKISLGAEPVAGAYESNVTISNVDQYTSSPYTYYIRAYITNEKGTVYGKVKSFTFPVLSFNAISPQQGKTGDVITLHGNNFSTIPANNIVKFNDTFATVKTASATQLTVEVPAGVTGYYYDSYITISVIVGSQLVQKPGFKILPSFTDFSPKSGTFGDVITITGSNFYGHSYSIRLGEVSVSANTNNNNSLTFSIPSTITSESFKITIVVDYNATTVVELPGEFTMIKPVISSISPTTGIGGSIVTLTGTGFSNYYYYANTVKFGSVQASIYNSTSTELKVYVPSGLVIGESYDVTVFTGVHTATAPSQFTVGSPSITDFTPKTANNNSYITITGTNFGNFTGSVLFGSIQSSNIYSWSNTSIQVQIPSSYYLPAGTYKITVNAGGQSAVSTDDLTIL
jgi:hypothetical protein